MRVNSTEMISVATDSHDNKTQQIREGGFMQVIQKARGQGKTTELIKKAAKSFSYIVCPSKRE